jgi:tryptophan 2,3-dioxygenase
VNDSNPSPDAARAPQALSYGSYLKIPDLLSLQKPLSAPAEHDEMLFIIIHQVYELWFKQMIHEVGPLRAACMAGETRKAQRHYRRLIEIQRVLLQQISILETMTPADFLRFRNHLNPASGFQSRQFRELEFLSGMKDTTTLPYLNLTAEEKGTFERRLAEPDLRDAFDQLLRVSGFAIPELSAPAGTATSDPARASRLEALRQIFGDPATHYDLYNLCEAMIEYDENFQLWRYHHVLMVERMIGRKPGTGGTEGVAYLATTLKKRCFPELWEVRTLLGNGDAYGARPPQSDATR